VITLCRDCDAQGEADAPPRRCAACGSPRVLAHAELDALTIAHLDCDAFYASVEKRDRPELKDRPVIVGGGVRGVVTTACYIARTYGPRSAMPMFKALKLCPDAVVIRPDFAKYVAESRRIMEMIHALTPLVQPLSLDEAWIDLSGTQRLNGGSAAWQLVRLQRRIELETGLTVSIGLAPNKVLAKIASDLDKPRGFAVIGAGEARDFLSQRPVTLLPGVGPAFARSLEQAGFTRIGQLAEADPKALAKRFGAGGLRLYDLAHGRDARAVNPESDRKGVSAETTFDLDLRGIAELEDRLWACCEKVGTRTRAAGLVGRVATLKLKTTDFRILTRRRTLPVPTQTSRTLFAAAREMLAKEATGQAFRLIGAGLSDLEEAGAQGGDFFGGGEARALDGERALDALRARFGARAVITGRSLRSDR
jgi:DNA polymerase IV